MGACDQTQQVHLLHDGELPDVAAEALRLHLAQCESCTAELERLRAISRQFDMASRPRLPELIRQKLLNIPQQEQERSVLRLVNRLTAMAASIAIVGTVWTAVASSPTAPVAPPDSWESAAILAGDSDGDAAIPMAEWVLADLRWEQGR